MCSALNVKHLPENLPACGSRFCCPALCLLCVGQALLSRNSVGQNCLWIPSLGKSLAASRGCLRRWPCCLVQEGRVQFKEEEGGGKKRKGTEAKKSASGQREVWAERYVGRKQGWGTRECLDEYLDQGEWTPKPLEARHLAASKTCYAVLQKDEGSGQPVTETFRAMCLQPLDFFISHIPYQGSVLI